MTLYFLKINVCHSTYVATMNYQFQIKNETLIKIDTDYF